MLVKDFDLRLANFSDMVEGIEKEKQLVYNLREQFVIHFTENKIKNMTLEEYALGFPKDNINFCHSIESTLTRLGNIHGSNAKKFGFYYGYTKNDRVKRWRFKKSYGSTPEHALSLVKRNIISLLDYGKEGDIEAIDAIDISPMFKGKILSVYYPEKYLNIFSFDHLDNYLLNLGLVEFRGSKISLFAKRNALLQFKNEHPIMKNWKVDTFSEFLYHAIGEPKKRKEGKNKLNALESEKDPIFPKTQKIVLFKSEITLDTPATSPEKKIHSTKDPPDYEKKAAKMSKLGAHGETLILQWEKRRLKLAKRPDLALRVEKRKLDSDGYDILSFEVDGRERQIEVKATRSKIGVANFFLSANEYIKSQTFQNYYVYILFDITSKQPRLWEIKNPFYPKNESIKMTPISYRVEIKPKQN